MKWDLWIVIGLLGQSVFFTRFLVQWIVSEKKQQSTIPLSFWYLSLAGGLILLTYALYRKDPVFIVGQSCGVLIYMRNLMLIRNRARIDKASFYENDLQDSI